MCPDAERFSLLTVRDLAVRFHGEAERAVENVSFALRSGQTLAVVGESGCGKSVTALSIMRLLPPGATIERGAIRFRQTDLLACTEQEMRRLRGGSIAMIFQEPMTSLNPVLTIGEQLREAVRQHHRASRRTVRERAIEALRQVEIPDPAPRLHEYPHEFSGGMRQRVMIAMALLMHPAIIIADEPTTALDVSTQRGVLDLLRQIQRERELGLVLITHDFGVVAHAADMVCVMYAGRVVEYAGRDALFSQPMHSYTRGLLSAVPRLHERRKRLQSLGNLNDAPRSTAPLVEVKPGHWVAREGASRTSA